MKKKKQKNPHKTEQEIHAWLQKADLAKLEVPLVPTQFKGLKPTDWDQFYEEMQVTRPISLRLPVYFIHRLKQQALKRGIAYQTLIRLWIGEKLTTSGYF